MIATAATSSTGFGAHAVYLIAAIPFAIAVVVSIFVWRNARRERASLSLRRALSSPDPEARRAALDGVADDTLREQAPVLVELLGSERDPDVLDALAAAVARSRWEPTTDPALIELRRWVAGGHAQKTRSSAGAPEARAEPAHAAEPVAEPAAPVDTAVAGTVAAASTLGAPSTEELAELVPKVRALLGGRLERLELVSIDGEVLTRWAAGEGGEEAPAPTERQA